MSSKEVQRLLDVALDAKLTLASDPAGFLASLRARAQDDSESWDPSCSLDLEEEAEGQVGSDVSLALDPDDSSLALSLPGSFDRDLYPEYLLKIRDAMMFNKKGTPSVQPRATAPATAESRALEGELRVELSRLRGQLDARIDSLHGLVPTLNSHISKQSAYIHCRRYPKLHISSSVANRRAYSVCVSLPY
jgi:hypothetical protein